MRVFFLSGCLSRNFLRFSWVWTGFLQIVSLLFSHAFTAGKKPDFRKIFMSVSQENCAADRVKEDSDCYLPLFSEGACAAGIEREPLGHGHKLA